MNVTLVYRGRYLIREALDLETLSAVLRGGGARLTSRPALTSNTWVLSRTHL